MFRCSESDVESVLKLLQEMSGEVVDSNPYSRLMALKRMGIVNNYEDIRKFSVAIVVSPRRILLFSAFKLYGLKANMDVDTM